MCANTLIASTTIAKLGLVRDDFNLEKKQDRSIQFIYN